MFATIGLVDGQGTLDILFDKGRAQEAEMRFYGYQLKGWKTLLLSAKREPNVLKRWTSNGIDLMFSKVGGAMGGPLEATWKREYRAKYGEKLTPRYQ